MPRYDVHKNPDGTTTINGYTFPAGAVPDFARARVRRADGLSATQAQTLRRQAMIEAGRHPFGRVLRQPAGQTCGTCAHCTVRTYSVDHYKCALMRVQWTKGPGTDLRKRWPACEAWEPGPNAPPNPPPQPDPMAPALDVEGSGLAPALGGF